MLDEIDADFAGPRTSAQAANRQGGIWKQRLVARLDDQAVEELKPAATSFEVVQMKLFFSHRSRKRRRNAERFEIERSRIAGRVGLMIVEERAGLVLLETENPVRHFEREIGNFAVGCDFVPGAAGLRQPRDLSEVRANMEPVPVIAKSPRDLCLVNRGQSGARGGGERE